MGVLKTAGIGVLALAVLGAAGFYLLTDPSLRAAPLDDVPTGKADLANGERLFWAGGCASCHAVPGGDDPLRLGGGLALRTDFGTFHSPNISPSADGIGGWSVADFARAMRDGVSPSGEHYYPAFPYTSYRHMTGVDLRDLHGFVMSLEPVEGTAPPHQLGFPFGIRRGLGLWKLVALDDTPLMLPDDADPLLARGAYLVEGPAHCAECHSPRNALGVVVREQRFAGGPNPDGPGFIPNITPHETGIGSWTRGEIVELLTTGFTPDFDVIGGSMAHVVDNTARLPDEDREAMAVYLLSLEPRPETERPPR